jgi:uncharacterized protein
VQWLNEPAQWSEQAGSLVVTAGAGTDFWRITGYGYIRDNGHLYAEQLPGDFDLSMRVRGSPVQVMNTAIATNWHVAAAHTKA